MSSNLLKVGKLLLSLYRNHWKYTAVTALGVTHLEFHVCSVLSRMSSQFELFSFTLHARSSDSHTSLGLIKDNVQDLTQDGFQ
jgi:hypothetical protein